MTILFVHGTGVREAAYDRMFDELRAGLALIRPGRTLAGCYWGDEHGARLHAGGVSIPTSGTRGMADEDDPDLALWWTLQNDPLFELRLMAAGPGGANDVDLPPSEQPPWERLADAARALPGDRLATLLADAGLVDAFAEAVVTVLADIACRTALRRAAVPEAAAGALARAIVAHAITPDDEGPTVDGDTRDELVRAVIDALGAAGRGVRADSAKLVLNLAMRAGGSRVVDRRRLAWSEAAAPVSGDVLKYLARGHGIRTFIADRVAAVASPVIVLAHSLGGIAAVELLTTRAIPQVELLITVGSQAPLLYELDALPLLPFGQPLAVEFPRWVNIFDPRDLLAYRGAGVFPGRVVDIEVDNRTPFPSAHSSYFHRRNRRFYRLLDKVLP